MEFGRMGLTLPPFLGPFWAMTLCDDELDEG